MDFSQFPPQILVKDRSRLNQAGVLHSALRQTVCPDLVLTTYPFHLSKSEENDLSRVEIYPVFYRLSLEQGSQLQENDHISPWDLSVLAIDQGWVKLLSECLPDQIEFYPSLTLVYRIIRKIRDPQMVGEMIQVVLSKIEIIPTILAATIFFEAIKADYLSLVQLLLADYRFDLRPYLENGLSLALKKGYHSIVRVLIREPTLTFIGKRDILVALSIANSH